MHRVPPLSGTATTMSMYIHVGVMSMFLCTRRCNERKQATYMHVTITKPHNQLRDTYREGRQQSSFPLTYVSLDPRLVCAYYTPLNGLNTLCTVCMLPQFDSSKPINGSIEHTLSCHAFKEQPTLNNRVQLPATATYLRRSATIKRSSEKLLTPVETDG